MRHPYLVKTFKTFINLILNPKFLVSMIEIGMLITMNGQNRKNIKPGVEVDIVLKQDQRTGKKTRGIVKDILTKSPNHPHGIKVRLETGEVGRVQEIIDWYFPYLHGLFIYLNTFQFYLYYLWQTVFIMLGLSRITQAQ